MSLFLAVIRPTSAAILTDTLATTPDGEPCLYVTKATPVPHMQTVMVCTGIADFGDRWAAMLRNGVLALDVEMLDAHAPGALRDLWDASNVEALPAEHGTSTIYHLGMTASGECHVYAYRSTANFASERLPSECLALKPEPADVEALPEPGDDQIGWLVAVADHIRTEQAERPVGKRIFIGGDLFLTIIDAVAIEIRRVHRFPDHAQAWNSMNELARISHDLEAHAITGHEAR